MKLVNDVPADQYTNLEKMARQTVNNSLLLKSFGGSSHKKLLFQNAQTTGSFSGIKVKANRDSAMNLYDKIQSLKLQRDTEKRSGIFERDEDQKKADMQKLLNYKNRLSIMK